MAHTRDTPLRRRLIDLSRQYDWLGLHPQPFGDIQEKAAYGFLILGPAAKTALPDLISMLDDPAPEVHVLAAFAIGKIGPDGAPALPALQRLITNSVSANLQGKSSTDEDRALAAYALGSIGPAARPVLPQIELLRKDSNVFVRAAAEAAFIKISGTGLEAILESLKDPSNSTNWTFVAIGFLGTNGAPAIPFLIPALQDTNAGVRYKALAALSEIHMSPETTIPAILPFLAATNTNNWTRANSLTALRNFGPSARGLVPMTTLLQALQDPDENIRIHATNALRQIDPGAARKAGIDSGADTN
jgi:HEAT repeat protein